MAAALLFDLHGRLLRLLSENTGRHFNGLQQAARYARNIGLIDNNMFRRCSHVDITTKLLRHITPILIDDFVENLHRVLGDARLRSVAPLAISASCAGGTSLLVSSDDSSPDPLTSFNDKTEHFEIFSQDSTHDRVRCEDAVVLTSLDASNAVILDDPSALVMAAVNNAYCTMASAASAAALDVDDRLRADLAAIVASRSCATSVSPSCGLALPVCASVPPACEPSAFPDGWSPPLLDGHLSSIANVAGSFFAHEFSPPTCSGSSTRVPADGHDAHRVHGLDVLRDQSPPSRAVALAAAVDARLQCDSGIPLVPSFDVNEIIHRFYEFINELYRLWQNCLEEQADVPVFVIDTFTEEAIQQFFQDAVDIFVD